MRQNGSAFVVTIESKSSKMPLRLALPWIDNISLSKSNVSINYKNDIHLKMQEHHLRGVRSGWQSHVMGK